MKFLNYNICLTSRTTAMIALGVLLSTITLAAVMSNPKEEIDIEDTDDEMWVPTAEDIAYQDSMYTIIQNTQDDITDIKQDIFYILERLDYEDGTWDSIRYVKGGAIDKRRSKQ